ncbi:hypothetical protein LTR64_004765 [Lithohypha guttulata]|uniref:uncharacterized protein n=1 Tax=Lithohypha guttulata TaxID=1690604 RepID=UPI002DE0A44A|nr:hypothetical protein LTR51_005938 [Lithohypha guttulata]
MAELPPVRRIVTDHSPDGKAIIGQDQILTPANPLDPSGGPPPPNSLVPGFTSIFRTDGHPASAQGPWTDPHGQMQNLVSNEGVVCRIVDFPPVPKDAPRELRDQVNIFHRTTSVDYGVVLDGELDLVLDDGVRTTVGRGDVVVQRGTNHLWQNNTKENCRVFFVLVPAKPIKVETTGELLKPTNTKHLEETKEES